MPKLHLICGECGSNENFYWGYKNDKLTSVEDVNICCKSCGTEHSLNDYADVITVNRAREVTAIVSD